MVGHLVQIRPQLGEAAADIGEQGEIVAAHPAEVPSDVPPSRVLSLAHRAGALGGRTVGVLVTDGADARWLAQVGHALAGAGARLAVVAPRVGGVHAGDGSHLAVNHALASAPSVLFDVVIVAPSATCAQMLASSPAAVDWVRDAFRHLKVIGHVSAAATLLERAGVQPDADYGIVAVDAVSAMGKLISAAKNHRIWARDAKP
jgi:catalase